MIDVESLSFSYVSELTGDRVDALTGVDLSARPGTLTLVCGSSGCGKSTLMRSLTGLVPQMTPGELEGVVRINGRDLAEVPLTEIGHLCSSVAHSSFVTPSPRSWPSAGRTMAAIERL